MIRQVFGAAFITAAVIVPLSASAQGVPGGVERGAREGDRAAGPVGVRSSEGRSEELSAGSPEFWAPINGPAFAVTSSNSIDPHTAIRATSGWAPNFLKPA